MNAVPAYGMFGRDRRGGLAARGAGGDHAVPECEYIWSVNSKYILYFLQGYSEDTDPHHFNADHASAVSIPISSL